MEDHRQDDSGAREQDRIAIEHTRLVAELYRQVSELRAAGVDARAIEEVIEHARRRAERELRRSEEIGEGRVGAKIITVDFRRRAVEGRR